MKARRAVIVASILVVVAVWVAVLWRGPQIQGNRPQLPSLGSPPPATSPAPSLARSPRPGAQAGPAAGGTRVGTAGVDAEDLQEGDVEDEALSPTGVPVGSAPGGALGVIPTPPPITVLPSIPVPLPTPPHIP